MTNSHINLPETEKIDTTLKDGWLTLWFNSPENRNALSDQLSSELSSILKSVEDNRNIRGITLRGKGGVFCAGGDLKVFNTMQGEATHQTMYEMNRAAGDVFDVVLAMPQLVIAYIDGAAIAGGLGLMCCADIIVVQKDAKFALTETMIGIVPAQIAPIVVNRTGLPIAKRLMLTGARFKGSDCPDLNLADFVVDHAEQFDGIEASIQKGVKNCAPNAIGLTKKLLQKMPSLSRTEQKDFAAHQFASAILSDEGKEGIASFVEKRRPSWATPKT